MGVKVYCRVFAFAVLLLACLPLGAQPCSETPTSLTDISAVGGCSQCSNYLWPGSQELSTATKYAIISDLPETFCGDGVLYATVPVLPPDAAGVVPLAMRTQVAPNGFTYIDDSFDVFLFHNIVGCTPNPGSTRIVVYVKNEGTGPITINPKQIIINDGVIGTVHEMESNLGQRELSENWDTPISSVVLAPGTGDVIAYSKRFNDTANTSDRSTNVNCFGRVRAAVTNANPITSPTRLHVYIVAIDGQPVANNKTLAEANLNVYAKSGDSVSITAPPSGCQIKRAVGVHRTFTWRGGPLTMDALLITAPGRTFQMALWKLVSTACTAARQSRDMELYPPFTHNDTIGNYHVNYRVRVRLINRDQMETRSVDLRFGKTTADVGLAWRVGLSDNGLSDAQVDALTVTTGWAGPNQTSTTRSFLTPVGGPVALGPCSAKTVDLRFLILGNSSLPFQIRADSGETTGLIVDNLDPGFSTQGSWPPSANPGFWGTNSLINQGPASGDWARWTPNLPATGPYKVYAWWVASSNRAAAAPFTVVHAGGTTVVPRDQRINGSQWNLLGTFTFNAGTSGYVQLTDAVGATEYVSADAVRWVWDVPVSLSGWVLE
ncbi:MAG: hypothetical protein N2111_10215 [Candidatus Sumerlaeaceae bacterium]|nr:hypothetical protein [Candidatus Sumerlaeaceae bacterium]